MKNTLTEFNLAQRSKKVPELQAGDIVKIYRKIKEGNKERTQMFEGIIIAIKGGQSSSPMITVRKVSNGIGVELILPIHSPGIEKIELVKRAKVRRAKLYYIRKKSAKSLRLKYKDLADFAKKEEEPEVKPDQAEVASEIKEETPTKENSETEKKKE